MGDLGPVPSPLQLRRVCNSRNNSESLHLEGWSKTEMRSCMKSLRTAPNALSVTGKP